MLICPHPLLLYLIIKEPLYSQIPSGTEVLWAGKQGWGALDSSPPEPLGAPSHRHHPSGWGFAAVWLAQGHRENLYWSKTKDVRLQRAVPHSKGRLSHSDKALQLAIEPSDYVIHTKNTRHFHQLLTSLLSFFPAGQSNYLMCMQRHNKISTTRMVTLHSWSTSSLLFSPKIEIRRGKKKPTSFETWQERQEIIPWVTGHSQHLFQLQAFLAPIYSTATFPSYSRHQN